MSDWTTILPEPSTRFYSFATKRRHIKQSRLVMYPTGRWGFRWLHALVFRAAVNLGMVGHDRTFIETIEPSVRIPSGKSLSDAMQRAILDYMRRTNYRPDDLEVLMGQDQFAEIQFELRRSVSWRADISIAERRDGPLLRWNSVEVRLVPHFGGFAIVPKRGAAR